MPIDLYRLWRSTTLLIWALWQWCMLGYGLFFNDSEQGQYKRLQIHWWAINLQCLANAVVFQTEDGVIVDCADGPKPEIKLSCNGEVVFVSVLNICLKMCAIGRARTDWDRLTQVVKSSQISFSTIWEICFYQLYMYLRCTCGNCQRLQRVEECICCPEIDCIVAKKNEAVEHEEPTEPLVCMVRACLK